MARATPQNNLKPAGIAGIVTFVAIWVAYFMLPTLPATLDQAVGPFSVVMSLAVFIAVLTN